MKEARIRNLGSRPFPFFEIVFNGRKICSTDNLKKAKYLAKIITQNPFNEKTT